jgi:FlaA1/EpsC-like NDP-sugar epimerase
MSYDLFYLRITHYLVQLYSDFIFMENRRKVKTLIDIVLWSASLPAAYILRLEGQWLPWLSDIWILILASIPFTGLIIHFGGLNRQSWHNISIRDLTRLAKAVAVFTVIFTLAALVSGPVIFTPLSVPLIAAILAIFFLGGARVIGRMWHEHSEKRHIKKSKHPAKGVLIIGAGAAGTLLVREMFRHPVVRMTPLGFLDDDCKKQKEIFMGVPVLGRIDDMARIVEDRGVEMILIAMPTAPGKVIRGIVEMAKSVDVEFQIMPGLYELISGKFNISQLREVDVQDLLRRDHVQLDYRSISDYIREKVVLVTGAGGSIGSEIVRQIIRCGPRKILLLGRGENSIFKIANECRQLFPQIEFVSLITDVRDLDSLEKNFVAHRPQVVFHAAAHKHVPLMEDNPDQAILNNVGGTRNLTNLALKYKVKRFVNISSDKSVNPTSVMGASKRVAEFIVEWASCKAEIGQVFVSVRFGNVLGSRGSVVPLFKQQIENGGPITITHPDMTRYFMTIPEASQLVIQAGGLGGNGSVYVLDMGEPVRIVDLANDLIRLSGLNPGEDIEIDYTGMRPGEKMYEELLTDEESTSATRHTKIFSAKTSGYPEEGFDRLIDELFEKALGSDGNAIREHLKVIIPTYEYEARVVSINQA